MPFGVSISVKETGRQAPQYDLDSDLSGDLTLTQLLDFLKRSLIIVADTALRDEQSRGFDKQPIVAVDGRVNKAVIDVSPVGKIEFTSRTNAADFLTEIYDGIQERSPVDTGLYKSSNFVFVNGKQVATNQTELETFAKTATFKDGDIVRFANVVPYARKLERHAITAQGGRSRTVKNKRKGKKGPYENQNDFILAANGAYYLTSRAALRKYKRNAKISFEYITGSQLGVNGIILRSPNRSGNLRRTFKKDGRSYLYPSIKIVLSETGIL